MIFCFYKFYFSNKTIYVYSTGRYYLLVVCFLSLPINWFYFLNGKQCHGSSQISLMLKIHGQKHKKQCLEFIRETITWDLLSMRICHGRSILKLYQQIHLDLCFCRASLSIQFTRKTVQTVYLAVFYPCVLQVLTVGKQLHIIDSQFIFFFIIFKSSFSQG